MRLAPITVAGVAALAVVTAGCSGGKSPSGAASSQTPSPNPASSAASPPTPPPSSSAQGGPLDQSTCLNISFTKDNLMVAQKAEDARRFADTLERYGPPDPVKAAIEHFATTVGAQPNDPDLDANRDQIIGWIKQICPTVNP
jgi:hypothetical protein